jgi:hypothetical protein
MATSDNSLGYLDQKISEILLSLNVKTIDEANLVLDEMEKKQT